MSQNRERLDVEDQEARAARLGNLFTSISQPPSGASVTPPAFPLPPSRPHAIPESDVLARARAFLPLLAASNADVLARAAADPASVSIETPSRRDGAEMGTGAGAGSGEVVAMDIGLGVFDVKGEVTGDVGPVVERDAEVWTRAAEDSGSGSEGDGDSSHSESDSSESSEGDDDMVESDSEEAAKETVPPKVVEL